VPSVLVVGVLPYDSGKTMMTTSLVEEAVERGIDVGVSKPVGAFNGWYQYEYLARSIEEGVLIGEDATRLHESAKSTDPIEMESPQTVLLLPPDPEKVGWRSSIYTAITYHHQVAVIRVTGLDGTRHYYIPENIKRLTGPLREEARKLISALSPEPLEVRKIDRLLLESRKKADECLSYIKRNHELTFVESYNNFAAPTAGSLDSDVVVAVAPSKAAIFKGENYKKAITVLSSMKEPWKTVTEDILPLLRPEAVVEFGPGEPEGVLDLILKVIERA